MKYQSYFYSNVKNLSVSYSRVDHCFSNENDAIPVPQT